MKKYICEVCGYVYDPSIGDPEHGIPAGTPWEEVPEDYICPVCSVDKGQFEAMKEVVTGNGKLYVCEVCGYVYDPSIGDPEHGIPAGTEFSELPDSWTCPPCGAGKGHFGEMKY